MNYDDYDTTDDTCDNDSEELAYYAGSFSLLPDHEEFLLDSLI